MKVSIPELEVGIEKREVLKMSNVFLFFSPISKSFPVKIFFNAKSQIGETNFNWTSGISVDLLKVPKKALKKKSPNVSAENLSKYTKVRNMK